MNLMDGKGFAQGDRKVFGICGQHSGLAPLGRELLSLKFPASFSTHGRKIARSANNDLSTGSADSDDQKEAEHDFLLYKLDEIQPRPGWTLIYNGLIAFRPRRASESRHSCQADCPDNATICVTSQYSGKGA